MIPLTTSWMSCVISTGMCCRKGWSDLSGGCDGTLGIEGKGHVCVPTPTGAPRPVWMTSLTGSSSHWSLAGINSFHDSTEKGFDVRLVPGEGSQTLHREAYAVRPKLCNGVMLMA